MAVPRTKKARFRSVQGGGVRTGIDVGRMAAAVSRPGIDPRVWCQYAVVNDVVYDAEKGLFAEVFMLPDGECTNVLISSGYAGEGFGTFVPPKPDDLVLVAVPHGDTGMGACIIARVWSDPPPTDFAAETPVEDDDATSDPTTVIEPTRTLRVIAKEGANMRIEVDGAGKVEIAASGTATVEITGEAAIIVNSPNVRLGSSAANAVARVGDIVISTVPALIGNLGMPILPAPPVTPTPTGGIPCTGQITTGQESVKA